MKWFSGLAAAGAAALLSLSATADVTIIGALSNFDVPNETPEVCDEFEIEFEGPHPEDCYGTWGNYNYGPGRVSANATGTGILITYSRPGRSTQPHAIEHFGVHLRNFALITSRSFRWKHNGVVVTSGPGHPPVPIPTVTITPATPTTPPEAVEVVENEVEESIWVRRSVIAVPRAVALAELMPDNPLILAATPLETDLERLEPGETLEAADPLDSEDNIEAVVIVVETHADVATWNPAIGDYDHAVGTLLSRAMSATIVERQPCADRATILVQPQDDHAPPQGVASFSVQAETPAAGGEAFYQWHHDGVPLDGEDNDNLVIDPVTMNDQGTYTCTITNDCGTVTTTGAQLFLDVRPTITADPAPVVACLHGDAVYTAQVLGTAPFNFVWQKGSTPLNLASSKYSVTTSWDGFSSTLTIHDVIAADTASGSNGYRVQVSNSFGTRSSARAALSIGAGSPVTFDQQPEDVSTCRGGDVSLSIHATGSQPSSFVWMHGDQLADARFSAQTTPDGMGSTLMLTALGPADTGEYRCVVTNPCGTATSATAQVSVCAADWNCAAGVDSQDYFDFLEAFFMGDADYNGADATDSQDYFDFLEGFFAGC